MLLRDPWYYSAVFHRTNNGFFPRVEIQAVSPNRRTARNLSGEIQPTSESRRYLISRHARVLTPGVENRDDPRANSDRLLEISRASYPADALEAHPL